MIIKKLFDGFGIPAIGQGMGQYKYDQSQVEIVRKGITCGLSLIDTCEDYDNGYSEQVIGKAITGLRDQAIISTKFTPQHSAYNDILRSVEGSLSRLGTDYIDIYQPHWPNPFIPIDETLSAVDKLFKDGKIRHFGLGNVGLAELKTISSMSSVRVATVQLEYNLFNRTIENNGMIDYCTQHSILIIGYTPLDYGRVVNGSDKKEAMKKIANRYGATIAQLALRYLIDNNPIISIPKTSSITHVVENANAMEFNLTHDDKTHIHHISKQKVVYVKPSEIQVSLEGEGNRHAYVTIDEAIANELCFVPSPVELSKVITNERPVKIVRNSSGGAYKYNLIEGRIRYWAWVLANGEADIACLIREKQ